MAVPLHHFPLTELCVTEEYEHSERARQVTEIVELFVRNDSMETLEACTAAARKGPKDLGKLVTWKFREAQRGSFAYLTAQDLAVSDFTNGRIHWHDIAVMLVSE